MDTAKLQELIVELKAAPEPGEPGDDFEFPPGVPNPEEMIEDGADPQFVLYSAMQLQMLTTATMLEESGIVDEYHAAVESGLETYMPGYPPMSPVTDSFFYSWALLDLKFGKNRDNIGKIVVEVMTGMGMPEELCEFCGKMLSTRMGIYETIDADGDQLVVRELVTGRELLVDTPTGYFGSEGTLRFVRLGPPALPDSEYYTELTTPYLLTDRSADDWTRYLLSVMPQNVVKDDGTESTLVEDRLASVFKDDCGAMPWLEFVFQGYRGYDDNAIFLTGIPDDPASLPHGEDTAATNSILNMNSDLVRQAQALGITIIPPDSAGDDEIEIALTDAQRKAAAKLIPDLRDDFRPTTKGKKRILLPEDDWQELSDLAAAQLTRDTGRGRTALRNLCAAVDAALLELDSPEQPHVATKVGTVYRMRIDLRGIKPPIWRRIEVADCTLAELHCAVQAAMGWTNCHLHEFTINGDGYSIPDPFGYGDTDQFIDSSDVWLSDVIRGPGVKFAYMYDFGDGWDHTIKVEAVGPADSSVSYPRCLTGKRNCPPEDCGGVWGYQDLLDILSDPNNPEYEERIDWCGKIDPEEFDAASYTDGMQAWLSSFAEQERPTLTEPKVEFDINAGVFDDDRENDKLVGLNSGPGSSDLPASAFEEVTTTIRRETPRLGRNDPCHCGSGRKYKKCCLSKDS